MSTELEEDFGIFNFLTDQGRGAKLLPEFLKNSDNIVALINAILPEIQELHGAQKDMFSTVNIYEAVGTQLDDIFGEILNTKRETSQTDTDYRDILLVATAKFAKSGDISTVKSVYRTLTDATKITLIEYYPATFIMNAQVESLSDVNITNIRDELNQVKQGGNEMDLSISIDSTPFSFISVGDGVDSTLGFSSLTTPTVGGTLATVLPKSIQDGGLLTEAGEGILTELGETLIFDFGF